MSASIPLHRLLNLALLLCLSAIPLLHSNRAQAQSCSATTTSLAFGNVDVVSGSTSYGSGNHSSTSANIAVTCSASALIGNFKFSVCINISGGSASFRQMSGTPSTNKLNYNIYSDSAHTTVWGAYPSSPGPVVVPSNFSFASLLFLGGSSGPTNVPIYGYLQSSQNSTAIDDSYSDTGLVSTLSWNYNYNALVPPGNPAPCTSGPSGSNGSTSFTLMSTATVTNDCAVSATTINFGNTVGMLTSPVTTSGTITATCTNTAPYTIALNRGTTSGSSLSDREMAGSGSAVVHYQLYTNASYTTIWGDGTASTSTASGTGSGVAQNYPVYARVQTQTTPAPGLYNDTILVTVSY
ncbi:MAG: peptidase [Nevskia sp.]|nr:peptidase [Nevskia sp.]